MFVFPKLFPPINRSGQGWNAPKLKIDFNLKNGSEWKTFGTDFLSPVVRFPTQTAFTAPALFSQSGVLSSRKKAQFVTRSADDIILRKRFSANALRR